MLYKVIELLAPLKWTCKTIHYTFYIAEGMQNFATNADIAAPFLSAQIRQETQSFHSPTRI